MCRGRATRGSPSRPKDLKPVRLAILYRDEPARPRRLLRMGQTWTAWNESNAVDPVRGENPILNQVRLSPELIDLLSRRALAEGTTRSELIRRLVEAGLHETHRIHGGFRQVPQGASTGKQDHIRC